MTEPSEAKEPPKTKEQLQAEVSAIRSRLADNIESLVRDVHPKTIANQAINDTRDLIDAEVGAVKQRVSNTVSSMKKMVGAPPSDESGSDEPGTGVDRMLVIGGAIAGLVAVVLPVVAITVAITRAVRAHKKSQK